MMGPSQNFLLYNRNIIKMKVTEWINNLKKCVNPPPLFGDIYNMYSKSKKKRNMPIYFNRNYRREIKLVPIIMDYSLL